MKEDLTLAGITQTDIRDKNIQAKMQDPTAQEWQKYGVKQTLTQNALIFELNLVYWAQSMTIIIINKYLQFPNYFTDSLKIHTKANITWAKSKIHLSMYVLRLFRDNTHFLESHLNSTMIQRSN